MNAFGRKKVLIFTALVFGLGGLLKAGARGAAVFTVGRFLSGTAAGSAAFPSILIVFIIAEKNEQWRVILLIGGIIGFAQAAALVFLPESPSSLVASGDMEQARKELIKIRGTPDVEGELASYQDKPAGQSERADDIEPLGEDDPLLEAGPAPKPENIKIGLLEFITKREYRLGFMIVAGVMLAQQLTGINAVVFYGVSILHDLLPNSAKYLNAAISGVNLFVTLGASFLFDKVSHRSLLIVSIFMMGFFALVLAISISSGLAILSAIATLLFVSSFSMGLGPLPWMVASRRIEPKAVGAAQSTALTANWMGTFLVSFAVPVIAHAAGMAVVFWIFAALGGIFFCWGLRYL
ncbi:MFS general substrate transporter [Choiromyces venosus 120613-1]|uniref:MFS general substrate transporter n=1 Tax=Choiromyces venosus 120613-1 TaxID=1336337 RepID=A0A3N4IZ14_9PEZI|nr:MFS general substrate transporter [Choiromyces venosus 120613-1]